jgi:phosphoketolase
MEYAHKEGVKDSVPLNFTRRAQLFFKENEKQLDSTYSNIQDIQNLEQFQALFTQFMEESYSESMQLRNLGKVREFIKEAIMFEFARNLYTYGEAYQTFLMSDETFIQAVEIINNDKIFRKFKVAR